MSTPVSLLRAPNNASKLRRSLTLISPHSAALILPIACKQRWHASVHYPKNLPDAWFNGSAPGLRPSSNPGDHRPPDERTLKLGKSMSSLTLLSEASENLRSSLLKSLNLSCSNSSSSSSCSPPISSTDQHSLPAYLSAALSLHASTSTHRHWSCSLRRSTVDLPTCMGTHAHCRKRKAGNSIGAYGQKVLI